MGDATQGTAAGREPVARVSSAPPAPEPPQHWEADVLLSDGRPCRVRPIRPTDAAALQEFHASLSAETVYFRYFAPYPELSPHDVHRFTNVDHSDRVAFVAVYRDQILGVGRFDRLDDKRLAEVAFTVRDDHQGRGIGAVLLEHLAAAARELGVERFVAEVLPTNQKMLGTFEAAGYTPRRSYEDGFIELEFGVAETEASRAVTEAREHRAEARSVETLLRPRRIVVAGASRREHTVGRRVLQNLLAAGFTGPIELVHPDAPTIEGITAVPSFADLAEAPDLVIVAVPAEQVPAVAHSAAAAGAHALIILSSGFSDAGPEGAEVQRSLVRRMRASGVRVLGPAALGVMNTDPDIRLNATLQAVLPPRGSAALFAQSGPQAGTLLNAATRRGIGLTAMVSAGNRADVSANDLLQHWVDDDETNVVLLHLESVGNPRKFARIARRLSERKPLVMVRSGRMTQAFPLGNRLRRTTLPPQAVEAVFAGTGMIQTRDLGDLLDIASLLVHQSLPRGRRVAVVSTSTPLTVFATDALMQAGLTLAGDVVWLRGEVTADHVASVISGLQGDPAVDALLVLHSIPVDRDDPGVPSAVAHEAARLAIPIVAVSTAAGERVRTWPEHAEAGAPAVPVYPTVENAVAALASAVTYNEWRTTPRGEVPDLEIDIAAANAVLEKALESPARQDMFNADGLWGGGSEVETPDWIDEESVRLDGPDIAALLSAFGIVLLPWFAPVSENDAVGIASDVGFPVVLKSRARGASDRPDFSGIRLDLHDADAVRRAWRSLQADSATAGQLVVQRQYSGTVPAVITSREDALFGPVVSYRVGTLVTDLLGDDVWTVPPITDVEARRLVRAPRAAALLDGAGAGRGADEAALADLIVRVGLMADELTGLAGLVLKPVLVGPEGAVVASAAGWVASQRRGDLEVRTLGPIG